MPPTLCGFRKGAQSEGGVGRGAWVSQSEAPDGADSVSKFLRKLSKNHPKWTQNRTWEGYGHHLGRAGEALGVTWRPLSHQGGSRGSFWTLLGSLWGPLAALAGPSDRSCTSKIAPRGVQSEVPGGIVEMVPKKVPFGTSWRRRKCVRGLQNRRFGIVEKRVEKGCQIGSF